MIKYPARWEIDGDGFFIQFIDIPNAFTEGDTMEELIKMAEDALAGIIACIMEDNKEVPKPSNIQGDNIIYIKLLPEVALPLLIKKTRNKIGVSQGNIAQRMKIPYQTYQRWERAEGFNPTLKTLKKIARSLEKKLVVEFE